ncbi:MAG: glycosyltransferase family 2 protein [Candidatus Binatota bacterium]|nr:glycosyltransferase family 2 protein [Candidatus Binatota bacterium]
MPSTLQRIQEYLSRFSLSAEIIVVLDGPTDATLEIARTAARDVPQLKILDRKVNRGKGYTVREGMLAASGQIRLFCDADNSTDIAHFDKMQPLFDQGYDIVIASRSAKDAPEALQVVSQAWYKRVIGRLGNRIVQIVAVPGIWDTQCGFKAFRAEAAERIFAQTTIERWGFDIEVLALAQRLGYKIGIVPARWLNDDRSNVKLSDYLHVLGDTFTVRRNLLSGKYRLLKIE